MKMSNRIHVLNIASVLIFLVSKTNNLGAVSYKGSVGMLSHYKPRSMTFLSLAWR